MGESGGGAAQGEETSIESIARSSSWDSQDEMPGEGVYVVAGHEW